MISHKIGHIPARCLAFSITLLALALSSCGGGGSGGGTSSAGDSSAPAGAITGVAAVGLPLLQGTVTVKDATGAQLQSAVIDSATGAFSLSAIGGTPPYFLKAQGKNPASNADVTLYSMATESGTANINPFTNLIVATAAMNIDPAVKDPAALFADPARFKEITSAQLASARANVMTKLSPQVLASLQANGATSVDPIRDVFTVGKGLDKVFDNYAIHVDGANGVVNVADLKDASTIMPDVSLIKLGPASAIAGSYYYSSPSFGALFVISSNGGFYGETSGGSYQGTLFQVDAAAGIYTARLTQKTWNGNSLTANSRIVFSNDTKQLVLGGIGAECGDLVLTKAGDANSTILAADVQNFLIVNEAHTVTLDHDPTHKLTYVPDGSVFGSLSSSGNLLILAPDALVIDGPIQATKPNSSINIQVPSAMSTAITGAPHPTQAAIGNTTVTSKSIASIQIQDAWNTLNNIDSINTKPIAPSSASSAITPNSTPTSGSTQLGVAATEPTPPVTLKPPTVLTPGITPTTTIAPALATVICPIFLSAAINPILSAQGTSGAAANWNIFNIDANSSVNFDQATGGMALNRVSTPNSNLITGSLSSNGQIFLANANGIIISSSSSLGLLGTTGTAASPAVTLSGQLGADKAKPTRQ